MELDVYVVIKDNLGTPQVRVFSDENAAKRYAYKWYQDTLDEEEQLGHRILGADFNSVIAGGVIETEIGEFCFDLLKTKVDGKSKLIDAATL